MPRLALRIGVACLFLGCTGSDALPTAASAGRDTSSAPSGTAGSHDVASGGSSDGETAGASAAAGASPSSAGTSGGAGAGGHGLGGTAASGGMSASYAGASSSTGASNSGGAPDVVPLTRPSPACDEPDGPVADAVIHDVVGRWSLCGGSFGSPLLASDAVGIVFEPGGDYWILVADGPGTAQKRFAYGYVGVYSFLWTSGGEVALTSIERNVGGAPGAGGSGPSSTFVAKYTTSPRRLRLSVIPSGASTPTDGVADLVYDGPADETAPSPPTGAAGSATAFLDDVVTATGSGGACSSCLAGLSGSIPAFHGAVACSPYGNGDGACPNGGCDAFVGCVADHHAADPVRSISCIFADCGATSPDYDTAAALLFCGEDQCQTECGWDHSTSPPCD